MRASDEEQNRLPGRFKALSTEIVVESRWSRDTSTLHASWCRTITKFLKEFGAYTPGLSGIENSYSSQERVACVFVEEPAVNVREQELVQLNIVSFRVGVPNGLVDKFLLHDRPEIELEELWWLNSVEFRRPERYLRELTHKSNIESQQDQLCFEMKTRTPQQLEPSIQENPTIELLSCCWHCQLKLRPEIHRHFARADEFLMQLGDMKQMTQRQVDPSKVAEAGRMPLHGPAPPIDAE
ncbi:hypothetical protein C8F01DRAFT_1087609 [Mycena amicta]|nr:hypothetical protein C8F01DRAFT_1087609 [Mycena amicta]